MAMDSSRKICPDCGGSNPAWETRCRSCGRDLVDVPAGPLRTAGMMGYEYVSRSEVMGFPLLHIVRGLDPETGRVRVARGIIAIGNIAIGVFALGGVSMGIFSIGGVTLGLIALGGFAGGVVALGGMAIGALAAAGGMALSLGLAVGGLALGRYTLDSRGPNQAMLMLLRDALPTMKRFLE